MKQKSQKYRFLFFICVTLSLFLHAFGIVWLNRHLLLPMLPSQIFNEDNSYQPQQTEVIDIVFENPSMYKIQKATNSELKNIPIFQGEKKIEKSYVTMPLLDLPSTEKLCCLPSAGFIKLDMIEEKKEEVVFSIERKIEKNLQFSLAATEEAPLFLEDTKPPSSQTFLAKLEDIEIPVLKGEFNLTPSQSKNKVVVTSLQEVVHNSPTIDASLHEKTLEDVKVVKKNTKKTSSSFIPKLEDLKTISCGEDFDIDIVFNPREDNQGYIFAITLVPKYEASFKKMKQNFFFLLDRSNSIQLDRLTASRHAISGSLSFMNDEDRFNILAFDKKVDFLSESNLEKNKNALLDAKKFLRNQKLGHFFSSTDISLPLYDILERSFKDDEFNAVILITDGQSFKKNQNFRIINDWTKKNEGNISFFTLSMTKDKNLPLLDVFCARNKGKLITSKTFVGTKHQLQKLIKSIRAPIAKNIVSSVMGDEEKNVVIYPLPNQLPHLYAKEPYVILGSAKKLEDFTLFIQGRNAENWFNLKKIITFSKADEGGKALDKQWAIQRAYECYEKYFNDEDQAHLNQARSILKPYDIEPLL